MIKLLLNFIFTFFFINVLFITNPAYAYLDPGTGSVFMSAIIGFVVAIGFAIKTYWYKLLKLFRFSKKSKADSNAENEE